tara:strand:+ start:2413 stop:2859 length:447 start_codon:yes stop_codon:yes gene_type:complete
MFATFDTSLYPRINIFLDGAIENDDDYRSFVTQWENSYLNNIRKFTFVINTLKYNASISDLRYSFQLSAFINSIKEKRKQDRKYNRLQRSIIIVNSTLVRYLLETVFFFQQPLAPVYIVESVEKANQLFYNFENDIENNYSDVSVVGL